MQQDPTVQHFVRQAPALAYAQMEGWKALVIDGPQREKFVKGLVSNKVRDVPDGGGNASLILTVKGRIISELLFVHQPERFVFLVPEAMAQTTWQFFDHYHVIEDVEIKLDESVGFMALFGSSLSDWLAAQGGAWPEVEGGLNLQEAFGLDEALWATRFSQLGALPMLVLTGSQEACKALESKIADFESFSADAFQALRAECGWLDSKHELHDLLVHEAALQESHVNFKKGCWVGQEVVARTEYRGKANKGLFLLRPPTSPDVEIPRDTAVIDQEGAEVGKILASWTLSDGQPAYRALLRLKAIENPTSLQLQLPEKDPIPVERLNVSFD